MNTENQHPQPSPEMYTIPAVQTEALEQARINAQEFANTTNESARSFIDVVDVPGHAERVEVEHDESARREIGHAAVEQARRVIPIENPSPQVMRNAIGSPYYQDRLGRLDIKKEQ